MDKMKMLKISIIILVFLIIVVFVAVTVFSKTKKQEEEIVVQEIENNVSEEISTEDDSDSNSDNDGSSELTQEEINSIISDGKIVMYEGDKRDFYKPDDEVEMAANSFEYVSYTDEEIAREHLNDYLDLLLFFPEEAYKLLDEEYKEKRFGNIERFREYIADSTDIFNRSSLNAYKVEVDEEGIEYLCRDSYKNYYIFKDTSLMNYNVQLDMYTLNEDTAKSKFEEYSNEQKVQVNAQRFFAMIDSRDYIHAYECLDETFRNNKFGSYENFKEYIKRNFFKYNDIKFNAMEIRGETYIYDVEVSSRGDLLSEEDLQHQQQIASEQAEPETSMDPGVRFAKIVMKLGEGIDFVMSFSLEDER